MKHSRTIILLLISLLSGAPRSASAVEFSREESGLISYTVGAVLSRFHYQREAFSEAKSQIFLDQYLDRLDPRHMVFLAEDVETFQKKYAQRLQLYSLIDRDATPAFEIFETYLKRVEEVTGYTQSFLEQEFDFTVEESREVDRSEKPWPADEAARKELWRKRIKDDFLTSLLAGDAEEEIREKLAKRYNRFSIRMSKYDSSDILQVYLSSLGHSYDPHSGYMSPAEAEDFDIENITLEFTGIGATLQEEDGYTKIISLVPGGPAASSGELEPGDKIMEVAQGDEEPVDVVEMKLRDVVDLIRGPIDTTVRLTVRPGDGGDQKIVPIVRDRIELEDQLARAHIVEIPGADETTRRFGVLDLPQFYEDCAEHLRVLLERLKEENVEGVVLDLAGNSGGLLDEAQAVAGLFIDQGPVVAVKDFYQRVDVLEDPNSGVVYDGPVVVHVNRLSASASEIVAAALQDYERAVIVGAESTHGKGTVQTVTPLERHIGRAVPNPGRLKFTVQKFYRVNGVSTQKDGVTPDIVLPSVYDHLEWIGEANLDNALPSDRLDSRPITYPELGLVNPHVGALRAASQRRIEDNQEFKYVQEDIQEIIDRRERDLISLNKATREAEEAEDEARDEARSNERKSREADTRRLYRLTMETAVDGGELESITVDDLVEEASSLGLGQASREDEGDDEPPYIPLLNHYLGEAVSILADYSARLEVTGDRPQASLN